MILGWSDLEEKIAVTRHNVMYLNVSTDVHEADILWVARGRTWFTLF